MRALVLLLLVATATPAAAQDGGAALYDRLCLACHGAAGDGAGPAAPWLSPRPRDFTTGRFKWTQTSRGTDATDADLAAAIRWGVPGTSMPAFAAVLTEAQLQGLITIVRGFAPARTGLAMPLKLPPPPAGDLVARGQVAYRERGCVVCHGEGGRGDGPAAVGLRDAAGQPAPPYDLTVGPLRRPRAPGADRRAAIFASLTSGLDGTPMLAFAGSLAVEERWAIAAYVDSLLPAEVAIAGVPPVPAGAIAADEVARVGVGVWPGGGAPAEAALFGGTIELQGPPPASLAPAQASLRPEQCGRCHAKQLREWGTSLHALAASPGLTAQFHPGDIDEPSAVENCLRCHAPLAEQQPQLRPGHAGGDDALRTYATNPAYDATLAGHGIACAACHVRAWTRHGPAEVAPSLLRSASYPFTPLSIYERSDFCLPCHQLPARQAVAGRPLLDTYREWLHGPYMPRGIQCQHCHMPNREHTFLGVHDPTTFRQAIAVDARAYRTPDGIVTVRAGVANVGAGHYLPTTPTPAAWLRVELLDAAGQPIEGARGEMRIGRDLTRQQGAWVERADTRIPPGERRELAVAWQAGRVAEAVRARVWIDVHPDDFYEGFYRARLRGRLADAARADFAAALARAEAAHFVAHDAQVSVE